MNKQCRACGSVVSSDARFCPVCGNSDFVANNMPVNEDAFENTTVLNDAFENTTVMNDAFENTTVLNDDFENTALLNDNFAQPEYNSQPVEQNWQQPAEQNWQQPVNQGWQQPVEQNWQQPANQGWQQPVEQNWQQPVNQNWQQPAPVAKPKKKNTGLIIGIIAGVLIILAVIGVVAEKAFQNAGYGDDPDYDYSYNDDAGLDSFASEDDSYVEEKVEYTKGTFDGSVYVNEWADIKISLPAGFVNADAATYASCENSTTECGIYITSEDSTSAMYICYEKLPLFSSYSEEEYLDVVMDSLKETTEITYTTPSSYSSVLVGGNMYKKAECSATNGYGVIYQNVYVRKIDNYMVFIATMGMDSNTANSIADYITGNY